MGLSFSVPDSQFDCASIGIIFYRRIRKDHAPDCYMLFRRESRYIRICYIRFAREYAVRGGVFFYGWIVCLVHGVIGFDVFLLDWLMNADRTRAVGEYGLYLE